MLNDIGGKINMHWRTVVDEGKPTQQYALAWFMYPMYEKNP